MKKLDNYIIGFSWLALILSVITVVMQSYGDYVIFSLFVTSVHTFFKFNFINWPYYVFPFAIILITIYKKYIYLCFVAFFVPDVMRSQVHYFYNLWLHPNTITIEYATILAAIVIVMVVSALAAGILSIIKLKDN
jgi:hypothetical protein